ncbi:MAG: FixH family protein [Gemmatimonadaceae bacterium]|jgi:nitrogen fixation protein FixH|nr:FixH family protein [Gemmatimonadaceae bacterium]
MSLRSMGWPIGITAILALTVGGNLVVYRLANDDPAFAIEQDYYRKGVQWDSTLARRAESVALGWRITPTVAREGDALRLTVDARDAAGAPMTGAAIRAEAFAIARSQQQDTVSLTEAAPGTYTARLPHARAGLWEVRLDVQHATHRWASVTRLDVTAP